MFQYSKGRHSVYSLTVHLVFVCKRRGKVFQAKHLDFLKMVFDSVCDEFESELLEMNGEQDHVHLLVSYPPKHSVSSLVNSLKGVSSRRLKLEYPELSSFWSISKSHNALWSPSYFASSTGGATIEKLKEYIQSQESPS
jgi:putative transposase